MTDAAEGDIEALQLRWGLTRSATIARALREVHESEYTSERIECMQRFIEYIATGRLCPDGTWVSDYYGVILDLNQAALETLRSTREAAARAK